MKVPYYIVGKFYMCGNNYKPGQKEHHILILELEALQLTLNFPVPVSWVGMMVAQGQICLLHDSYCWNENKTAWSSDAPSLDKSVSATRTLTSPKQMTVQA